MNNSGAFDARSAGLVVHLMYSFLNAVYSCLLSCGSVLAGPMGATIKDETGHGEREVGIPEVIKI
jgi:hypothetical protein